MQNTIIILDFGSQYTQLIARRIRELNVYCEIHPYNNVPAISENIKGIILSGSPFSVRDEQAPNVNIGMWMGKLPILGICYGAQLIAKNLGVEVLGSKVREYGRANLSFIDNGASLFQNILAETQVWMSHGDTISELPQGAKLTASTRDVKVAAYTIDEFNVHALQFHPEVFHTTQGTEILKNFISNICHCSQDWTPESFVSMMIQNLKTQLSDEKVILGLSGGVDSTVSAVLLHQAIGKNLTCIFVDNGLLRKDEFSQVLESYTKLGLNVIGVNAADRFLDGLAGISDPEQKRKIIGKTFIDVFDDESHKLDNVKWLAQGTIYPDVIESISVNGPSQTIKSHHNVGGLPDYMRLKIVEPLRTLFKDEVRQVGLKLGLEKDFINRHPFPGPGLAIRILSDVTREKVKLLQEIDHVYISLLKSENLYDQIWQAFAVLLPVQSVGVMGDERTYDNVVGLRAVTSTDGMTADWAHLPYEFLAKVSNEIINKVKGVNRVVYDISSKPPATIEWE